jgi:hypothetical protein
MSAMGMYDRKQRFGGAGKDERERWFSAVREYITDVADLNAAVADESETLEIRSCAAILAAAHSVNTQLLLQHEKIVTEGAAAHAFIASATLATATLLDGESLPSVGAMIVRLVARLPEGDNWRPVWESTIRRLRELSSAPVTTANVLPSWLS